MSKEELEARRLAALNTTFSEPSGILPLVVEGWDELAALLPPEWILEDVIRTDSMVLLFGPPKTFKTTLTFALMVAILLGRDFAGKRVKKGKVLYLAAEGKRGLHQKLQALAKHHGVDRIDGLHIISSAPQIGEPGPMEALMAVLDRETFDLIVIDTAFKHFAKFDALGVLAVVTACEQIRMRTGAAVMLVSHATKGGKGKSVIEFGGVPLMAGVDTAIALERVKNFITLHCKAQRSDEDFDPIRLQTKLIELERDGEKITVPVVTTCDGGSNSRVSDSSAADRETLRKILRALDELGGQGTVKQICEQARMSEAGFHRHKDKLLSERWVAQAGDRQPYELTDEGREALMKLSENSHES